MQCGKCQLWVHTKCNKINIQTFKKIFKIKKKIYIYIYVYICSKDIFLSSELNDKKFNITTQGQKIKFLTIARKRRSNGHWLLERINDAIDDEDLENSATYFDVRDLNNSFRKVNSVE